MYAAQFLQPEVQKQKVRYGWIITITHSTQKRMICNDLSDFNFIFGGQII